MMAQQSQRAKYRTARRAYAAFCLAGNMMVVAALLANDLDAVPINAAFALVMATGVVICDARLHMPPPPK